jgi:Zn-dependent protease with chaperone function
MDFFDAQDRARRKTWWLIALFALAVVALIVMTNLLVALVFAFVDPMTGTRTITSTPVTTWLAITVVVCLTIAAASGSRWWALRSGGRAVAEALGGRLVHRGTTDLREQRLLNVVDEMAIASGTPVPPVFVIPEPSINAFAAGFTPDDAVIGVNRGTLDHLTREELQGVIGHEFSHILENDTALNLRLIAVLHGILFLGLAGQAILRTGGRSRRNGLPVALLGLGLVVIGYSGTFFGNLIKAGVSRSREYLADSGSVRFTRNPGGLAGALKKIGGLSVGSGIASAAATEASHMFFGQPRKLWLNALLATHPPLDRRIVALEPGWDRRFPVLEAPPFAAVTPAPRSAGMVASIASAAASGPDHEDPQVREARALIERTPARERFATRDPWAARALVFALLIDDDPGIQAAQLSALDLSQPGLYDALTELGRGLERTDAMQRMALLELAVPALKELSLNQYHDFVREVIALVRADERISLLEWSAHRMLLKELTPHFERPRRIRPR